MQKPQEIWVWSLSQEDLPERKWQPTVVFLPGEFNGQRILVGYSPWGPKESDPTKHIYQEWRKFLSTAYTLTNLSFFFQMSSVNAEKEENSNRTVCKYGHFLRKQ